MADFRDRVTGADRREALEALVERLAWKLDAGICSHCGGPRGEAAGFASLTLRITKLYEALDALPRPEEESDLDSLTKDRESRRNRYDRFDRTPKTANSAHPEKRNSGS